MMSAATPMSKKRSILVFTGTRPVAVKLAPVVTALRASMKRLTGRW